MTAAVVSTSLTQGKEFDQWSFHLSVGRRAAKAKPSLQEMSRLLLQVPGVESVVLDIPDQFGGSRHWCNGTSDGEAVVEVGPLRVGFRKGADQPELVKFVAQQVTLCQQRMELQDQQQRLLRRKETLTKRLETRKFYLRAAALLQVNRKLTERQSYLFLLRSARSLHRSLLHVSRTVISMEEQVVPITRRPRRHYSRH